MNSYNKSIAVACVLLLVVLFGYGVVKATSPIPVSSVSQQIFFRNLKVGDVGVDVLELQKLLNKSADTRIAEFGVGSLGNESTYFGEKTKNAVIRFQNKYASEVLSPAGLSYGTGLVGLWTRMKLNSMTFVNIDPNIPSDDEGNLPESNTLMPENKDKLTLSFISDYFGPVGKSVTITGTGFSLNENTILFGKKEIKAKAQSSTEITFKIPSTIAPSRYAVKVKNSKGTSKEETFFVVTRDSALPPVITSVSPAEAKFGDEITVTGENFSPTGNEILSGVGIFSNLSSSDGKTIKFELTEPDGLDGRSSNAGEEVSWPVDLYIVNGNGVNGRDNPGKFTIKQ